MRWMNQTLKECLTKAAGIIELDSKQGWHGLICPECKRRNTKRYEHIYKCQSCSKEFTLKEWWESTSECARGTVKNAQEVTEPAMPGMPARWY